MARAAAARVLGGDSQHAGILLSLPTAAALIQPLPLATPSSTMAARPLVTVHDAGGDGAGQAQLPAVFLAPIRPDVVSLKQQKLGAALPRQRHQQEHSIQRA